MYNIKTLNKISQTGLSQLNATQYTCADNIDAADAVLVRSGDMLNYEFNKELKCIARAGAGVNNIPIDRCSEAGIVVFNTPGANANAVKELVICGLLLSSRKITDGITWAKTLVGEGDAVPTLIEKGKGAFVGPELYGKKLGVIGLGAIGVMVANTAQRLGMEVYGYDPYISVDAAWGLSRSIIRANDLKTIYDNCDYITLHVPLNNETRGMLNTEVFSTIKKGVRVVNFARNELVDTDAMLAATEDGTVGCYVTDFPDAKLIAGKNVVAIPHLGASTPESEENCAIMAVSQMKEYLESGNIVNSVNFPNMDIPREGANRVLVMHRNIPKMVGGITNAFAEVNINIENMLNKSKKDYAFTVVDTNDEVNASVLERIRAIEGIINVRVIK